MKQEDKAAYEKWRRIGDYIRPPSCDAENAWEAACSYRDAQPAVTLEIKELEFGMNGEKMCFKVGVQMFTLDYEPETTEDFEFMKKALTDAISNITNVVNTAQAGVQGEPVGHYIGKHSDGDDVAYLYREIPKNTRLYTQSTPAVAINEQLLKALEEMVSVAQCVDSWEFFPSLPIERAEAAIAAAEAAKGGV